MDTNSDTKVAHSGRYLLDLGFTFVCFVTIMYFNIALA